MQALAERMRPGGSAHEQHAEPPARGGGGAGGFRVTLSRGTYSEGLSALSHLYGDDEGDDEGVDEDDALIAGLIAEGGRSRDPSRDDDADNADMGAALFDEPPRRGGADALKASETETGWGSTSAPAAADWALVDENAGGSGSGSSVSSAGEGLGGLGSLTAAVAGGFRPGSSSRILSALARPRPTTIFDDESRKPLSSLAAAAPPVSAACDGPDDDIFEHVGRLAPSAPSSAESVSHDVEMT
jgi:hypothetical protein